VKPLEIKIELLRAGIRHADIARAAKVSGPAITRVIEGDSTSDRLQRMIAKAIQRPVDDVFPQRGQERPGIRVLKERLAG
jgi:lambda repressor-like predicted transcriptional regulator